MRTEDEVNYIQKTEKKKGEREKEGNNNKRKESSNTRKMSEPFIEIIKIAKKIM